MNPIFLVLYQVQKCVLKMSTIVFALVFSVLFRRVATSPELLQEVPESGSGNASMIECDNTWFIPNGTSCVCGDSLNGKVRCNNSTNKTELLLSFCMTYNESTGTVVGGCPFFPTEPFKNGYITLPINHLKLNNFSCGQFNSRGQLCGECEENYAPGPLSYNHNCVECSHSLALRGIVFFTVQFIPITLFFFLALIFRLSATTGPLNAFVFFSEVYASPKNLKLFDVLIRVSINNKESFNIFVKVIFTLYGFWNLDFFRLLVSGFCLSANLSSLEAIAMEYIVAVYVLLLTVICYVLIELHDRDCRLIVWIWRPFRRCFARFRQQWNVRSSLIGTFTTFFLLSYMKLTSTSIRILNGVFVYDSYGKYLGTFLYYDATVRYFTGEHIILAVIAILVLVTVVAIPPLILVLYQFSFFHKCMDCCKLCTPRMQNALKVFVEAFQGCYKDGSDGQRFRDFRYFAGLYFVLRIVIAISDLDNIFSLHGGRQAIVVLFIIVAMGIALLRPYKLYRYNVFDAIHFIILAVIYFLLLNGVFLSFLHENTQTILGFVCFLSVLPLLYATVLFIYWFLSKTQLFPKFTEWFKKKATKSFEEIGDESSETSALNQDSYGPLPDRLLNPDPYQSYTTRSRLSAAPVTTSIVSLRSSGSKESSMNASSGKLVSAWDTTTTDSYRELTNKSH